jgi:hypothetical protein
VTVSPVRDVLAEHFERFGEHPFLITVDADGAAHVVSVTARLEDRGIAATAGNTSRANVNANPAVTLLWPGAATDPYALIVDGAARLAADASETLVVQPSRAVLHRRADADEALPSCVRLIDR